MKAQTQLTSTPRSLHTPAPWRVIGDSAHPVNARITSNQRPHIAKVYGRSIEPDSVCEANARLIAAAPDLLEALREAVALLGQEGWDDEVGRGDDRPMVRLRAAIAKAEGAPSVHSPTEYS